MTAHIRKTSRKISRYSPSNRTNSRGLTLIELMISIVIGAVILLIATGIVKSSVSNRGVVRNHADLQTSAYFVSSTVYQQLTQIGFRHIDQSGITGRLIPIAGVEQAFPAQPGVWAAGQLIRTTADSLWYRFDGASNTAGNADGSIFDCLGNPLNADSTYEAQLRLINSQLVCTVGTESAVLVGENDGVQVEQIEFTLGVDTDGDGSMDTQIAANSATTPDFLGTKQITLRMLLASRDHVIEDHQTYHYNGTNVVATDYRLRSEAIVSAAIRN